MERSLLRVRTASELDGDEFCHSNPDDGGQCNTRPGDVCTKTSSAKNNHAPVERPPPQLPFPVRILSTCLLDRHLQDRSKEWTKGIVTTSFIDGSQQALLYDVHLESGFTIDINAGFVHIVLSKEEEDDNQDKPYCIIDSEEQEFYGRASSCEDPEDDEDDDCKPWPLKMLHSASQNFP
jgi:hypothetical protein